jgi:hypothetical protein
MNSFDIVQATTGGGPARTAATISNLASACWSSWPEKAGWSARRTTCRSGGGDTLLVPYAAGPVVLDGQVEVIRLSASA